jgi:hypothetical protein
MMSAQGGSASSDAAPEQRGRNQTNGQSWRKFNGEWWYSDPKTPTLWKRMQDDTAELPLSPPSPTLAERVTQWADPSSPIPSLFIGVTAALVALALAVVIVPANPAAVLAPVLTAIGAFTGHAAGHAAAKHK